MYPSDPLTTNINTNVCDIEGENICDMNVNSAKRLKYALTRD